MRVLFSVLPYTRGDINPYLTLTRSLVRAGHEVSWLSLPEGLRDFTDLVTSAGGVVLPTPPVPMGPLPRGEAFAKLMADEVLFSRTVRISRSAARTQVEDVRALVRAAKPDVVASDRLLDLVPALIAAELEGIPHAFVNASLQMLFHLPQPASDELRAESMRGWIDVRALFRSYGLTPHMVDNQIASPTLNTCFTTHECLGSDVIVPPGAVLVGPCLELDSPRQEQDAFPWERLRSDGRVVFVSFGSVYSDAALYAIIAEAAAPLDVQIVLSTGPLDTSFVKHLAGDVLAVAYAPQMDLLGKVRAFVTHGGLNSVNESLFHGVPLIVIPRAVDQRLQAHLVRTGGTGISLDPASLTVDACRAALSAILEPSSSYLVAARRVSESYRAQNGVKAVCDRLLALARVGRGE